ncbi:MAG: hypothetical protein EBS82_02130 [Methylocystaceae bacterium]|nr:hypothetical protein [Methylocystaceae bacterium]
MGFAKRDDDGIEATQTNSNIPMNFLKKTLAILKLDFSTFYLLKKLIWFQDITVKLLQRFKFE